MLTVAICDDEDVFCRQVEEYTLKLAESLNIPVSVNTYTDPEVLLNLEILFLDIQLETHNGIDVAKIIRQRSESLVLIFMTNYIQYAVDGYTVQAYRYLLKPISYTQFHSEVQDVFISLERTATHVIHTADGDYYLKPSDIRYIETAYGKKLIIHSKKETIETYGTLSPWETELGNHFFRVHNSFLVNMGDIRHLGQNHVLLSAGEELPVSKHRRKALQNALMQYVKGGNYS